jgi:hypothetical protein
MTRAWKEPSSLAVGRALPYIRSNRPRRRQRSSISSLLAITAALVLLTGVASAGATSSIEGVWAFENGEIAIKQASNGTFVGTVVDETKFAECVHPVGEEVWTDISPQPDGSYSGHHQWLFEGTCAKNPIPGPTAWRVMQASGGSKYLEVCFSAPGGTQPSIAADGVTANVTYKCINSAHTAALPSVGVASDRLSLPSAKQCVSARLFKIHLADPKYDPLKQVVVTIRGHRIKTARQGHYFVATIDLKGFPRGAFTVRISATTVLRHHLESHRTYHTCAKRATNRKPAKHH